MTRILKALRLVALTVSAVVAMASAQADALCEGHFPNLVTDICWSCAFPMKMMGNNTLTIAGGEDYQSVSNPSPVCACGKNLKVGIPVSFWEMDMMTDVVHTPGCFPMLGGKVVDVGVNKDAYGTNDVKTGKIDNANTSFRQVNLYINPAMYVMGAVLDNDCMDNRGLDIPWVSIADPTHNDEELANILTPYAFPFGSLVAIGAESVDAIAATLGFPIPEIFWAAGSWGNMYPLTGTNTAHMSNEQTSRLQTARVLAKLHAAGTQWSAAGSGAMCSYYPQLIMDKRQYKFQRLYPVPQTEKILGHCCDPIGRTTLLTQTRTEAPLSSSKDFGYAIFRKRDCCSGVYP